MMVPLTYRVSQKKCYFCQAFDFLTLGDVVFLGVKAT